MTLPLLTPAPFGRSRFAKGMSRTRFFLIRFFTFALFFTVLGLGMGGCARTVTEKITYGSEMIVSLTFSGTPNPSAKYYMIFGNSSSIGVPDVNRYLAGPGDGFDANKVAAGEDYFTSYFSTWERYILFSGNQFNMYVGPFTQGNVPTPIPITSTGISGNTLQLSFNLASYFSTIPTSFTFTLVTVNTDEFLIDKISATESIDNFPDEIDQGDDGVDATDASLDITQWSVTIR